MKYYIIFKNNPAETAGLTGLTREEAVQLMTASNREKIEKLKRDLVESGLGMIQTSPPGLANLTTAHLNLDQIQFISSLDYVSEVSREKVIGFPKPF